MAANTSLQHDHYQTTRPYVKTFTLDGTEDLDLTLTYSCNGTVNLARLDFITLNYERELALRDGSLTFGLPDAREKLMKCGIDSVRLSFTLESSNDAIRIYRQYRDIYLYGAEAKKGRDDRLTAGHFKRGVQ